LFTAEVILSTETRMDWT